MANHLIKGKWFISIVIWPNLVEISFSIRIYTLSWFPFKFNITRKFGAFRWNTGQSETKLLSVKCRHIWAIYSFAICFCVAFIQFDVFIEYFEFFSPTYTFGHNTCLFLVTFGHIRNFNCKGTWNIFACISLHTLVRCAINILKIS